MTRFTDELRVAADELWEAQLAHPFVRSVADGTLAPEPFRQFVRQDYLFLIEYARLLALGCARAPRLGEMERLAALAREVLETEMELHRGFAAEWGISREALEAERPTATTRAYTDFLLRTAALGDFAELVAALLPCMWGYSWLGKRLAEREPPADRRLARWIETYASDEFAQLADWCREVTDAVAADAGTEVRARMVEAFLTSSRYELAFWEMAWREEPPL
jgi:thiaminase/transcriptional activator TenA